MDIRIAKVHVPVTALGPGTRVGVWLQGCSIGCRGCLSRDTWSPDEGTAWLVEDLVDAVLGCLADDPNLTGVTISGGEPFEQPQALESLIRGIREGSSGRQPPVDLLCYSGLGHRRLLRDHAPIVALLDVLVPEPFIESRAGGAVWRGSDNQPMLLLTPLAEERYMAAPTDPARRPFQVMVDEDGIWMIGVPAPGDLELVTDQLAARGITMEDVSWRP